MVEKDMILPPLIKMPNSQWTAKQPLANAGTYQGKLSYVQRPGPHKMLGGVQSR